MLDFYPCPHEKSVGKGLVTIVNIPGWVWGCVCLSCRGTEEKSCCVPALKVTWRQKNHH